MSICMWSALSAVIMASFARPIHASDSTAFQRIPAVAVLADEAATRPDYPPQSEGVLPAMNLDEDVEQRYVSPGSGEALPEVTAEDDARLQQQSLPGRTAFSVPGVYGDYDAEIRESAPRSDGIRHIDTPKLLKRLQEGYIRTYAYLIWHEATDWDDLRLEFLPAAQKAGITVWVYLTPPSEGSSLPFGSDYVKWATEIAKLSKKYPVLKAFAMDDFENDQNLFTPQYVEEMMKAAHSISPTLAFLPVNYDGSVNSSKPTTTLSTAFTRNYGSLINGVIFPYLNWQNYDSLSDEKDQIVTNYNILHGKKDQFVVRFPWNRLSSEGDYSALSKTISRPVVPYYFAFRVSDDYDGPTAGYHKLQVLVDNKVIWEDDTGGRSGVRYVKLNLKSSLWGKKKAVLLTVRVFEAKPVGNYGIVVNWDLPTGTWKSEEKGSFAGTGEYYSAIKGLKIPLIVMIYDGGYGGSWFPSLDYIQKANITACEAIRAGYAQGIIQYVLDKSDNSVQFPIIKKLYRARQCQPFPP